MSDPWTTGTPLSNSDFRALLATPRPHGGTGSQQTAARQTQQHRKEHKFKKPAPRKPKKDGQGQEESEEPAYRDRAKERREGRIDEHFMAQLEKEGLNPEALAQLNEEQSKFFGGDENFSHLVKGLDYALLERAREKSNQRKGTQQEDSNTPAAPAEAALFQAPLKFETPLGRAVYEAACRPPPSRKALIREMFLPRRTAFVYDFDPETGGSDIPTTLRRSKADCPPVQDRIMAAADGLVLERIAKIMNYLAGSMGSKGGKKARRKDHSDFIRSILQGTTAGEGDTQVHGQLVVKNQSAMTAGKGGGAAAAAAAAGAQGPAEGGGEAAAAAAGTGPRAGPVDEDDDIFGEAGTDYVPELPKKDKRESGTAAAAATRRSDGARYFDTAEGLNVLPDSAPALTGEADMEIEEGQVEEAAAGQPGSSSSGWQQQQGYGQYGQQQQQQYGGYYGQLQQQQGYYGGYQQGYGAVAAAEKARPEELPKWRQPTKVLKGFSEDAYEDAWMGAVGTFGDGDDDDEEGVPGKKKEKEGAEEGAAGKEIGAKDKGKEGKGDERRRAQKLDGQLHQIKNVFKEKGYGNEGAFKKEGRNLEVGMTPARSKRIKL